MTHAIPPHRTAHRVAAWRRRLTGPSRLLERIGGLVFIPALAALITLDVVLRYGFNAPLSWGLEANEHMLIIVFMFGLPQCTRTDGHIHMDLLSQYLSTGARRAMTILYSLVGAAVFAFLVKRAVGEIPFMYNLPKETEFLSLPLWIFNLMIAVIAAFLVVDFLLRAAALLLGAEDGEAGGDTAGGGLI
jgi:TRAP-type C4-dicarboxylate transport system permease small subunit